MRPAALPILLFAALSWLVTPARAAEISLWARASTSGYVTRLVEAYNASHPDRVALNLVPNEQFVAKLGAAIAGGQPPDVISIDLIFVPSFARADQLIDITERSKALPFLDKLMPAHLRLATLEGRRYALPFSAEGSILLYNKALFRRAGLDPDKPPRSWAEIAADAEKITALGDGIYGYYFPGNCAGCNVFTFLPYIWAAGGDVLSADGTKATLDQAPVRHALQFYRDLVGRKLVPPGARTDGVENWSTAAAGGKIGIWPGGAFSMGALRRAAPDLEFGATFLPGEAEGRWASFGGGDSIAIPKGTRNAAAAWDFVQWTFTPDAQVEILAKNGTVPVRTDLDDNKYTAADPRLLTAANAMAKGQAPYSLVYNDLFNSPQGPFLRMLQTAVFGNGVDAAVAEAQRRFQQIIDTGN